MFQNIVSGVAKHLHTLTLYFQGEPYLNKSFLDMVAFASHLRIFTVTSTNAHYLDVDNARRTVESGLGKLIISVDGITEESYRKYRVGGKLSKVLMGTKNLIEQKRLLKASTPHIVWQVVAFRHNEKDIPSIKRLAKKMGVNEVQVKTAQIYDFEQGNELMPKEAELSRYTKGPDGTYMIKNELRDSCWRMWQGCVVTWDGKIVPCCFDKDAKYQLGSVANSSFGKIWRSQPYHSFREKVLTSRKSIDICTNCTEGTRVFS